MDVVELMFDENSFLDIQNEEDANSFLRFYSQNVAEYRQQLMVSGMEQLDIDARIDVLWERVLKAAVAYRIPFTAIGQENAKRIGFIK